MKTARPNILLLVIDCARADRYHGVDKTARTPVFDRLAAGGVSLPTTITETACTTPCFAGLLTGAYSFRHGIGSVGGYALADQVGTLPERLSAAGYHTYAEVTGPLLPATGLRRGFAEYKYRIAFDFLHTRWGDLFLERLRSGGYRAPWLILLHLWEIHVERQVAPPCNAPEFGRCEYDRAVSSLDRQLARVVDALPQNTLTILTGDHGEKTADETYAPGTAVDYARRLYRVDETVGPGVRAAAKLIGPAAMYALRARFQPRLESFSLEDSPRELRASRRTAIADYLRLLRLAPWLRLQDFLVLRSPVKLTRMLERRGVLDVERNRDKVERLIRAVGEERLFDLYLRMWIAQFRTQLEQGHVLALYDYLVRVPLLLHWPGRLPAGARIERMVRHVDLPATILQLLGIPADAEFSPDGRSLLPLIRGGAWEARPAFLSVSGQPKDLTLRGIRTEAWKFTYGPQQARVPCELYDLRNDPREQRNLAGECPDRCEMLRRQADAFIPHSGPCVCRADDLTPPEAALAETRLRELGYVE